VNVKNKLPSNCDCRNGRCQELKSGNEIRHTFARHNSAPGNFYLLLCWLPYFLDGKVNESLKGCSIVPETQSLLFAMIGSLDYVI
jgi:hypothetical protein